MGNTSKSNTRQYWQGSVEQQHSQKHKIQNLTIQHQVANGTSTAFPDSHTSRSFSRTTIMDQADLTGLADADGFSVVVTVASSHFIRLGVWGLPKLLT